MEGWESYEGESKSIGVGLRARLEQRGVMFL
jgi:hypothetical protein